MNAERYVLRPARPDDAAGIAAAHAASWAVAYRGIIDDEVLDHPEAASGRAAGWKRTLSQEPTVGKPSGVVVAFDTDEIVGFAAWGAERGGDTRGELYAVYTIADTWGTGLGDALMNACLTQLERGYPNASLWALADNGRARRFYERHRWYLDPATTHELWSGPAWRDGPTFPTPVAEVRYLIDLG